MVLIDYKDIGDTLTTDEFNAIVSLLKHNKILSDTIEINNGAVVGEYGTYTFDLESTTIVDNGILITDETLTSLGTVTLSNPAFNNATYTLHLTVISMEEPNIIDDSPSETTTTDLTITLQKGTAVQIPFQTLTNYCIILFNATIEIKQDQPVIQGAYVTGLTLTGTKDIIITGESSVLTMKATDLDTFGVPNKLVKLYDNGTLINTYTTDANGEATYTYIGTGAGQHQFTAKHGGMIQSEIYEVIDALFFDDGVTSPKIANWYKSTNNYSETIDDTGTEWTNTSATQFVANSTSSANYFLDYQGKWAIEMDVISYDDVTIRIRESANSFTLFPFSSRGVTANSHLKIVYNGDNTLTYAIDDNAPVTINTIEFSSNIAIGIRLNTANSSLKFKNFKVYSI